MDSQKVVMGLTVRGRDADRFWFSLFHEVAHILHGDITNIDASTENVEAQADAFAAEVLIPDKFLGPFLTRGVFTESTVRESAQSIGIAPGIVVGRLQKENAIGFNQLNWLKTKYCII